MIPVSIVSMMAGILKVKVSGYGMTEDVWASAGAGLLLAGLFLALMLPLRLKYEAEKSRIVMAALIVSICLIFLAGQKAVETVNGSLADSLRFLDSLSWAWLVAVGMIVLVAALTLSVWCSLKIMRNKEF